MALTIDNISKTFPGSRQKVLENIHLEIASGEFLCLLGASGCGKSTLLNLVAGLDTPTGGCILHNGVPISGPSTERSYLFQEPALFPWLNVMENVCFGMRMQRLPKAQQQERAMHFLKMVKLEAHAEYRIHELSGGMKQRVALARALTLDSDILLMDEPFAALDAHTREEMYTHLTEIWQATGKTILFVTHNLEEAFLLGDRVLLLSSDPAAIVREYRLPRPRMMDSSKIHGYMEDAKQCLSGEVKRIAS